MEDEGHDIGHFIIPNTDQAGDSCRAFCNENKFCNSFAHCNGNNGGTNECFLKDKRIFNGHNPRSHNRCKTTYVDDCPGNH